MRAMLMGGVALVLVGLTTSPGFAQRGSAPQEAARNGWLSDFGQAREQARRSGKPIFLVFRCVP